MFLVFNYQLILERRDKIILFYLKYLHMRNLAKIFPSQNNSTVVTDFNIIFSTHSQIFNTHYLLVNTDNFV